MSDWYARKLAQMQGQAPPAPAPTSYPAQHPGYGVPQQPQGPPTQQGPTHQYDTSQIQVTNENVAEVAGLWQGGEGTKKETTRCPECHRNSFFSRSNAPGVINVNTGQMVKPNPQCMDCGYAGRPDWIQVSING